MPKKQLLVLMKDHENEASETVCASTSMDALVHQAHFEDLGVSMNPMRDVGTAVAIINGDELRIEETRIV